MKKRKMKTTAKLELDHYYPQSKYPFLCTSFYNLYPVCGNCNRAKSDNHINFELYTASPVTDMFRFWLDDESVIKYRTDWNHQHLKVWFEHKSPTYFKINELLIKKLEDFFREKEKLNY